jgi:hypothetical protein
VSSLANVVDRLRHLADQDCERVDILLKSRQARHARTPESCAVTWAAYRPAS